MNRYALLFAALLCVAPVLASRGHSQELAPEEPEIVLPTVFLELEDLSVESVTAVLPEAEEGVAPALEFTAPQGEEILIPEPSVDLSLPSAAAAQEEQQKGRDFSAEAELGIGTRNHIFGRLSLFAPGPRPGGKLLFQHETLDGFASYGPGEGYNRRTDILEGSIKYGAKKSDYSGEGAFREFERGLQQQGTFDSKLNRFARIGGDALYSPDNRFTLKGALAADVASQLVSGGVGAPEEITEYLVLPSLAFEYSLKNGFLGVAPSMSYRGIEDNESLSTERVSVRAYGGFDFKDNYRLEAGAGWFWGGTTGHLFPFDLGFEGRFSDVVTLNLKGGFRVEETNLKGLFEEYRFMGFPTVLDDNYGWFFDARGEWIALQGLTLNAGVFFKDDSNMPTFDRTVDAATGLFPFLQVEAVRVFSDAGLRWDISEVVSTRFGWQWEIADRPVFTPEHKFTLDVSAVQKKGRYGGGVTAEQLVGVNEIDQAPVLGVNGFVQATKFMRFTLELGDILYPLIDGPRYDWAPYVDTGFTLFVKALINF